MMFSMSKGDGISGIVAGVHVWRKCKALESILKVKATMAVKVERNKEKKKVGIKFIMDANLKKTETYFSSFRVLKSDKLF